MKDLFDKFMKLSTGKSRQINFRDSRDGRLRIFKYSKGAFWNRSWAQEGMEYVGLARGMVFEIETKNIVSYPFARTEEVDNLKDSKYCFEQKVNGFLAIAFFYNGRWVITSSGSFDSDYVTFAKEALDPIFSNSKFQKSGLFQDLTLMFEITHHEDPHIIPHPITGNCASWLIGARETATARLLNPEELDSLHMRLSSYIEPISVEFYRPIWFIDSFDSVRSTECKTEGFMVRDLSDWSYVGKYKTPYYKTMKFLARTKKIQKIVNGEIFAADRKLWSPSDPDYEIWIDEIFEHNFQHQFVKMDEQERLETLRKIDIYFSTKKIQEF